MLRRMIGAQGPMVLACLVTSGSVSCGEYAKGPPWGYRFWPDDESGSVTFEAATGETEQHALGEGCGVFLWDILLGSPPEWNPDWEPTLTCSMTSVPALYLYDAPDMTTTLDWPATSGPLVGAVWAGPNDFTQVELDVTIEVSEGALLDPPPESEPPPTVDDPATTLDYARRFRIQAEVTCAEHGLDCDGTWFYDLTYELSPDSVTWIYPPAE